MCKGSTNEGGTKIKTIAWAKRERNKPVVVDDCIAEFIEILNKYGIKTLNCCCGHGTGKGSVLISLDNIKLFNIDETMRFELKFNSNGDSKVE